MPKKDLYIKEIWALCFLMSIPYHVLLFLGGLWIYWINPSPQRSIAHDTSEKPAPLSKQEVRVTLIMILTEALWFTDFWRGLNPAIPALLAAFLLATPQIGILSWKDLENSISWSTCFILGSCLSLAKALISTGAAAWFASLLGGFILQLQGFDSAVILMPILLVTMVHPGIANMSACIALLIPITTTLAVSPKMNPIVSGLIVGIVVDAVILYPVQTATNLLAHETGLIGGKDVLKVGLVLLILTSLVILSIALPRWSLLDLPLVTK